MIAPSARVQLVNVDGTATPFFTNFLSQIGPAPKPDVPLVENGKATRAFQDFFIVSLSPRISIVDDQGRGTPFFLKFLGELP